MILGCAGLGDYYCGLQSLEVPVSSSGTQWDHSACSFAAHFGTQRGGRWKGGGHWAESGTLSSEVKGSFAGNGLVSSVENKGQVIGHRNGLCLDSEGIVLYIELPCSPCEDSDSSAEFGNRNSHEQILLVGPGKEGGIAGPALPTGSHEQLKMTGQAQVSHRSESNLSSNLSSNVLRALLETDSVPRFKRRRHVTATDRNPESASYMLKKSELLPSLKMPTSPGKEFVKESVPDGRDAPLAADLGRDQRRNCSQGEPPPPPLPVEKTESKTPLNLGTHALMALMEGDDVQKLKRRRLTTPTPTDSPTVKDSKDVPDSNSPDSVSRKPTELPLAKQIEQPLLSPDPAGAPATRASAESDLPQDAVGIGGPRDCISEMASSGKGKSDTQSDCTTWSQGNSPLDKYISRPPRLSGGSSDATIPKKKEWLGGQHHGGHGRGGTGPTQGMDGGSGREGTGAAQDVVFLGNVGLCYRSAIDKRPAAEHPGFVGDGATVQLCGICREREDARSSLICDACEEVFHMACVNARMKIVPRVDDWLCRPCKKKKKMRRGNEQEGSDPAGEPKDWWREDAGIGRVEKELLRMSNGRRMKARLGPQYEAEVPGWRGIVEEVILDDNLAETSYRFGQEVVLTDEQKQRERETAEYNLANDIWPKGWLPATRLPPGGKENWIQCMLVLFEKGDIFPDGRSAEKNIICGKWRRAPLGVAPNNDWECSCALVWDPRHADCAVPQELSTEEITERMKSTKLTI